MTRCTADIVDAAIKVHSKLGPGLLESIYEMCLSHELRLRSHVVQTQLTLPVEYEGLRFESGYRLDLLVDDAVVVELKAVTKVLPVHEAQLLSYLRLSRRTVGLLINFHEVLVKDGIKRMVNRL